MTIDFIEFVDEQETTEAESSCFIEDAGPVEAELYSDEPMVEPAPSPAIIDEAEAQRHAVMQALDAPVQMPWDKSLALGPKIAVFGVGGAGNNALGSLVRSGFEGATLIALNTDIQDLQLCPVRHRVVLGAELCRGRGAGGRPETGALAALENRDDIVAHLDGVDLCFVVFGAGGGTGSGAGPEICELARAAGCLTVAVATKPFAEEGKRRRRNANEALDALRRTADSVVVVANDKIDQLCDENDSVAAGFEVADGVLRDAVSGMVRLAQAPATGRGKLNVDFQDVRTVMCDRKNALMGIGTASGPNRARDAVERAIGSPLLDEATLEGATGVLCHIRYGSEALTMRENRQINAMLSDVIDEDAEFITGFCEDPGLGDEIAVLVVATGFDMNPRSQSEQQQHLEEQPQQYGASVRPARVAARAEVSADWRLGAVAERQSQRMEALARRQQPSSYQAPPASVAPTGLRETGVRRSAAQQPELALEQDSARHRAPMAHRSITPAPAPVAAQAQFNANMPQAQASVSGLSTPAQPVAATTAAARRAVGERPRRPAISFTAPEVDPGDGRLFGQEPADEGEPAGHYIENLTSLMPQPAVEPVLTAAVASKPFAVNRQQQGLRPMPKVAISSPDPVSLERRGQQNLAGLEDDVDLPPFLRQ